MVGFSRCAEIGRPSPQVNVLFTSHRANLAEQFHAGDGHGVAWWVNWH